MIKKVTKITVYRISEENETRLKKLEEAMRLIKDVMNDDEPWKMEDWDDEILNNHNYVKEQLSSAWNRCLKAMQRCEKSFTEEETEEAEEIID